MSEQKLTRQKVLMFTALHSRFSWEDIVEYRNPWIIRIIEGISQDKTKTQEVRDWASEAVKRSPEWAQRRYE